MIDLNFSFRVTVQHDSLADNVKFRFCTHVCPCVAFFFLTFTKGIV